MYAVSVSRGYSTISVPGLRYTHENVVAPGVGTVLEVEPDEMLGQPPIVHLVHLVKHEVEQIESRDQGRREIDVRRDGQFGVVPTVDRVGGGEYGSTRIERGDDTGFGDGYCLLFLRDVSAMKPSSRRRRTMTSCSTLRVASLILSNSSMQHTPPSERTNAPLP